MLAELAAAHFLVAAWAAGEHRAARTGVRSLAAAIPPSCLNPEDIVRQAGSHTSGVTLGLAVGARVNKSLVPIHIYK
jgi:hypothetical protein